MAKREWSEFFRTRLGKVLVRVGIVIGVLVLLLVCAYFAASKKPGFYRRFEATERAERKKLNDEFVSRTLAAYSQIQESGDWSFAFSDRQLNGWLSVDASSNLVQVFPPEIKSPRIAIHGDRMETAASVTYKSWSATLHVIATIRVPEPGVVTVRLRSAKIGVYPFDREKLVTILKDALDKPGWNLEQSDEGGDPVLTFRPQIVIEKKYELTVKSCETDNEGQCLITGSVTKIKRR